MPHCELSLHVIFWSKIEFAAWKISCRRVRNLITLRSHRYWIKHNPITKLKASEFIAAFTIHLPSYALCNAKLSCSVNRISKFIKQKHSRPRVSHSIIFLYQCNHHDKYFSYFFYKELRMFGLGIASYTNEGEQDQIWCNDLFVCHVDI